MIDQDRIIKVDIEKEMKTSYIDYSISCLAGCARRLQTRTATHPICNDEYRKYARQSLYEVGPHRG